MVTMIKDFRSDVDVIISGAPMRKPVVMKDSTFYDQMFPKCKKIVGGIYTAPSGAIVEFN
jgi:hypothetical protein